MIFAHLWLRKGEIWMRTPLWMSMHMLVINKLRSSSAPLRAAQPHC